MKGKGIIIIVSIILAAVLLPIIIIVVLLMPFMSFMQPPEIIQSAEIYNGIIQYNKKYFPQSEYEFPQDMLNNQIKVYFAYRHTKNGDLSYSQNDIDKFLDKYMVVKENKNKPIKWEKKWVDDLEKPIYEKKLKFINGKFVWVENKDKIIGYEQKEIDDLQKPIKWIKTISYENTDSLITTENEKGIFSHYMAIYSELSISTSGGHDIDGKIGNGTHLYPKGIFIIPLEHNNWSISSPYGNRIRTWDTGDLQFHTGTDFSGSNCTGWNVVASADGVVIKNGYHNKLGYYVTIDHGNGFVSRYQHFNGQSSVAIGTNVQQGEVIGQVGASGEDISGAHLHWVIIENGEYTDPMQYFY